MAADPILDATTVAAFFVAMTVPLARATDWLQRRWMERERAGAL